jgi:glycosyltransferase involved in cell wall biosynthesis
MNHFKNYFINIEKKLINIGIDSEVEQFDEDYKNNLKIHFNIPLNSKVIGTLARLHHLKGVDILIKSFEIMCKNRKDICLLIIGDGPERKKLENICKNSKIKDKIIFTGALEKPWEEAGIIMDVFVLPSYKENIPISILEAMARNIPVFASNVGGISEELPEHCIVENNDENQYSEKILSILEDKEKIKYIVKNNNLHLKNNFNVIKMVNILQEFYEQKYNL